MTTSLALGVDDMFVGVPVCASLEKPTSGFSVGTESDRQVASAGFMCSVYIGYCCVSTYVLNELKTYINKCIFISRIFSLVFMC